MAHSHFQAMDEQINNMGEAFSRFRDLYFEMSRSKENTKPPVSELESEITELRDTVKRLGHQNQELQQQIHSQEPELERAKGAREAAFRKLENAYRVIRDLVNEVERLQGVNGLHLPSQTKDEESEEMRQIIRDAMAQRSPSGSSETNSLRTVRPHSSQPQKDQQRTPKSENPHERRRGSAEAQSNASNHSSGHLPSPEASGKESADELGHSTASSFASIDDRERWSIHSGSKPPGVCNMSFGPVTYKRLLQHSVIAIQQVEKLKELEDAGDLCLRMHSTSNLVFVKDPIFLEERAAAEGVKKTYILDWGIAEENAVLADFIRSRREVVLHTFVFPEKQKQWFYVGGLTWHVANHLHAIWSSLRKTSRKKVLSKLCERSPDYDEAEVANKLDNGRLVQICFEIQSDGLWDQSREFALRMGYQARPDDH